MAIRSDHKGRKRAKLTHEEARKEEEDLETALFGTDDPTAKFGSERYGADGASAKAFLWADEAEAAEEAQARPDHHAGGAVSLWEDRTGDARIAGSDDGEDNDDRVGTAIQQAKNSGRVWSDPDDRTVQVSIADRNRLRKLRRSEDESLLSGEQYEERLRTHHRKVHPRTRWAKPRTGDDDDSIQLEAAAALGRPTRLPAGNLEVTPLSDANLADRSKTSVSCVAFHPGGRLLFTAGKDKRLSIFQIDGVKNPKVQSVFFHDMPIYKAAFCCGGDRIVASGRRRHFYSVDIAGGAVTRIPFLTHISDKSLEKFAVCPDSQGQKPTAAFLLDEGHIALVSLQSNAVTGTLKMNGSVRSAAFSPDGQQLLSSGGDGVVYTWDLRTQRCLGRRVDEGTLCGTSLACSSDYFATGSDGGVVNLHSRAAVSGFSETGTQGGIPGRPFNFPPLKSFMNLTTTVNTVAFSPDQQVLAMGSQFVKGSLRLVHVASRTVFSNWPTPKTPLSFVHSVAFSPNGGLLAVGTGKGRALLYRLNHYTSA